MILQPPLPTTFFLTAVAGLLAVCHEAPAQAPDFNRDVRPILAAHCFACHGPDEASRQADLRLDVREGAVLSGNKGASGKKNVPGKKDVPGKNHGAIVPGDSAASDVFLRLRETDPELRMPPPDSGHELTDAEIQIIGRWIDSGANYDRHWSFVPPTRPRLPKVVDPAWPSNPIDHFLLDRLEASGLRPAPEADRYTLIRRLSLDLTGLPPSPAEAERFVGDRSPDAYERVVDRLLASSRFGEHWARMWLDLARYADTKGYEKDQPREIWRYRDWVIDALNDDMPYEQFTREQLAGDLLPGATPQQILATAFHRNTMTNDEGGTDNEEFRIAAVKDRVDTTVQVWMGLTMGCAKCHSHKYDPITQTEYYKFLAYFNQTEDADRPDDAPRAPTPTAEQRERIERLREELAGERQRYLRQVRPLIAVVGPWQAQAVRQALGPAAAAHARLAVLEKQLAELQSRVPRTPVMRELPPGRRRTTHVHVRGNFLNPGPAVEPGFPEGFDGLASPPSGNRLDVARWLTAPANPLTYRVAVNRVWARLFGRGLVETEEDFGRQGLSPSHPRLLDWLAVEFRDSLDGSLKKLCKRIVMSATYRQSSRISLESRELDPDNRLLSRGPRFRLSAETIRDQALAAAGLLDETIGGASVMPPQPSGIWRTTYSKLHWRTSPGAARYRRGLYTFWRRTSPYPSMLTFDAGSREVCVIRRVRTNTPLQALVTLNDPVYFEAAGALAERVLREAEPDAAHRAHYGFRLVLTRPPTDREQARLVELYESAAARLRDDPRAIDELLARGAPSPDGPVATADSASNASEPRPSDLERAAWTIVANVLLNLDETLTRN